MCISDGYNEISANLPAPIPSTYSDQIERLKSLVLDSVNSPESKRAYGKGIADFLTWFKATTPGAGFYESNTYKVVDTFPVGRLPEHVTPSYDLKTLWVLNDKGSSLTRIDPATGSKQETIPVDDPYNMYYTPDGRFAIVVAEQRMRLMFRDAQTMQLKHELWLPCKGIDHMDFSANGKYLIGSCEFSGRVVKVDVEKQQMVGLLPLHARAMPQDVKLSPDGKVFYLADMASDGVWLVDGERLAVIGFIPTGKGTHGLYASRDSRFLYISNRGEGSCLGAGFCIAQSGAEMVVARGWESGYGRGFGGRQGAMAIRAV